MTEDTFFAARKTRRSQNENRWVAGFVLGIVGWTISKPQNRCLRRLRWKDYKKL
jgi:hypothetical protein